MSESNAHPNKLRSVFAKAARGELVPNNFGNCLMTAPNEGLCTKEAIAEILDTEVKNIRRAGNNLKPREIANVARAIVERSYEHLSL